MESTSFDWDAFTGHCLNGSPGASPKGHSYIHEGKKVESVFGGPIAPSLLQRVPNEVQLIGIDGTEIKLGSLFRTKLGWVLVHQPLENPILSGAFYCDGISPDTDLVLASLQPPIRLLYAEDDLPAPELHVANPNNWHLDQLFFKVRAHLSTIQRAIPTGRAGFYPDDEDHYNYLKTFSDPQWVGYYKDA